MDVFAGFHGRVLAAVQQLKHDGVVPHEASIDGITLEPPKDAAPRRPRHQCRHGAGQGRRQAAARAGRAHRAVARLRPAYRQGRDRRARLHQPDLVPGFWPSVLRMVLEQGASYGQQRHRQGRGGERGICFGQSDRADACRPYAAAPCSATRSPICSPSPASPSPANITSTTPALRSMRWRALPICATARRSARTIGEIPEGLYPGDYLKPVGQKLADQHGEESARHAGRAMAADRARRRACRDAGHDRGRPRAARHPPRRVLLRALA